LTVGGKRGQHFDGVFPIVEKVAPMSLNVSQVAAASPRLKSYKLAEARAQRAAMRAQLAAGTDPSRARRADLERERGLEAQRIARSRFEIDEDGALLIRLGVRHLFLTPGETAELRAFLTPTATSETPPCP